VPHKVTQKKPQLSHVASCGGTPLHQPQLATWASCGFFYATLCGTRRTPSELSRAANNTKNKKKN